MVYVNVLLVDGHEDSRKEITERLTGDSFNVIAAAGSLIAAGTASAEATHTDLVLLMLDHLDAEESAASLQDIRARFSTAKFVIVTAKGSASLTAFCRHVQFNACIVGDLSTITLTQTLSLIMLGHDIFPASPRPLTIQVPTHHHREGAQGVSSPTRSGRLSAGEDMVLSKLLVGHSNKMIARDLGMSEATVKVHLKGVLRKAHATNRTQAALWAIANGYSYVVAAPRIAA